MSTQKRSIRIFPHEREMLIRLYLERRIPRDQYEQRPEALADLTLAWNESTGRTDVGGDLLHYIRTQQKRGGGRWPRLDGEHQKSPPITKFSAEDIEVLVRIFEEHLMAHESGSDNIAYDEEMTALIAKEFFNNTGRIIPGCDLVAKITKLRKRGLLPKIGKRGLDKEAVRGPDVIGFSDLKEVDGQ